MPKVDDNVKKTIGFLKELLRLALGRCKDLVLIRQCQNTTQKPSLDLLERLRDNELHRINCENNFVVKIQGIQDQSLKNKRYVQKGIRRLYTLFKNNSIMVLEHSVTECLKSKSIDYLFSELHLNHVVYGNDY